MKQHRCASMRMATLGEFVEQNLLNIKQVFVRQPKKLSDGTKGGRLLLIDFCPWCGVRISS